MKAHTYYIIFGRPPIGGKLLPLPPLAAPLLLTAMLMYTAAELIVTRPARNALFNVGMWLSRDRRLPVDQLIGVYKQHHVLRAVVQRHRAGSDLIA